MTRREFWDKVIEEAIVSVLFHEEESHRRLGCLAGLQFCRRLLLLEEFERVILRRRLHETRMALTVKGEAAIKRYWAHRCATAQMEYVYECMKVASAINGGGSEMVSGRAIRQYARIVGIKQ